MKQNHLGSLLSEQRAREDAARHEEDDVAIAALMRDLYDVISFQEGSEPDWYRMSKLFSSHARITRLTPEGTDHLNVTGFQAMAKEMIDLGVYTSFYEHEVQRSVQHFGALAHVLSAYETKQSEFAQAPFARGVNSLQLIREQQGWRVLSLFWDEERPRNPLDLPRLFQNGAAHA